MAWEVTLRPFWNVAAEGPLCYLWVKPEYPTQKPPRLKRVASASHNFHQKDGIPWKLSTANLSVRR